MSKYDSTDGEMLTSNDASTITISGDLEINPPTGMDGLDELAAGLGIKPGGSNTLTLQGKSGDWYDWIALLAAHVKEMREITK